MAESILIVEDDRDSRELLAEALLDEGYGVGLAEDGAGAISYLRSHEPPDVILLDWRMPKSDGTEFCRLQQADPDLSRIPVVVMTGDMWLDASSRELGIAEVLVKPIDLGRLLELVARYAGPPPARH
jgi:CheY-like chemotaxis protein